MSSSVNLVIGADRLCSNIDLQVIDYNIVYRTILFVVKRQQAITITDLFLTTHAISSRMIAERHDSVDKHSDVLLIDSYAVGKKCFYFYYGSFSLYTYRTCKTRPAVRSLK